MARTENQRRKVRGTRQNATPVPAKGRTNVQRHQPSDGLRFYSKPTALSEHARRLNIADYREPNAGIFQTHLRRRCELCSSEDSIHRLALGYVSDPFLCAKCIAATCGLAAIAKEKVVDPIDLESMRMRLTETLTSE